MFGKINEELRVAKTKFREKQNLEQKLESIDVALRSENMRLKSIGSRLDKELGDVKKLQGLSFQALVHTILGTKEKQLSKEKCEFLAAKLKYDECGEALKYLNDEKKVLLAKHEKVKHTESKYKSLLQQKIDIIHSTKAKETEELFAINERIVDIESDLKELAEAIEAGIFVERAASSALSYFRSADSASTWDMLGDDFFSNAWKHEAIDKARVSINELQQKLRTFKRELADVGTILKFDDVRFDVSEFDMFADLLFDNLFSDISISSKISASIKRLNTLKSHLGETQMALSSRVQLLKEEVSSLEDKHTDLVENVK